MVEYNYYYKRYGGIVLSYFPTELNELLARVVVLFTAITIHEFSHGFVAYKLGDPTAKYSGRLTLNPIAHLDIWGALCMLLFKFGWAKPVPINPMYFRDRKRDSAICAVAGPVSNVLLAFVSVIILSIWDAFVFFDMQNFLTLFVRNLFAQMVAVNIGFAVFNLILFPPLDGSKILGAFLPDDKYNKLLMYERFGFPILMILSYTGVTARILYLFINPLMNLMNLIHGGIINILR